MAVVEKNPPTGELKLKRGREIGPVVAVAADGVDRCNLGQTLKYVTLTDVAGVENLLAALEGDEGLRPEQTVRV